MLDDIVASIVYAALINVVGPGQWEISADCYLHTLLRINKQFNRITRNIYPSLFRERFYALMWDNSNNQQDLQIETKFDFRLINEFLSPECLICDNKHKYCEITFNDSEFINLSVNVVSYPDNFTMVILSMETQAGRSTWTESSNDKFNRSKSIRYDGNYNVPDESIFILHEHVLFTIFPSARRYFNESAVIKKITRAMRHIRGKISAINQKISKRGRFKKY